MKKHDANSRGHSNNRPNGNGQLQRRSSHNSQNRPQNKKTDAKNTQSWINNTSKTLTSHLPGVNKGNGDKNHWKGKNSNGNGPSSSQGKNRGHQEWSNGRGGQPRQGKSFQQKNTHRRSHKSRQVFENNNESRHHSSPATLKPSGPTKPAQGIEPFELFCAYHLGIGPNNTYKPSNINQVAQRFGADPGAIRQATKNFGFDSESMLNKDFDLALAQLDIQVAPEGISKEELAKGIYEEFQNAPTLKRDWGKILEEDQKENARVFGS